MHLAHCCAASLLLAASACASAIDFKTVGAAPAILYDAPSAKGGKMFIAPPGMPVEVVLGYGEWEFTATGEANALGWLLDLEPEVAP